MTSSCQLFVEKLREMKINPNVFGALVYPLLVVIEVVVIEVVVIQVLILKLNNQENVLDITYMFDYLLGSMKLNIFDE